MTQPNRPALVINDGTIGGLVACWTEGAARDAGTPNPAPEALTWTWMPPEDRPARSRRRELVQRQTSVCGLAGWSERELVGVASGDDPKTAGLLTGTRASAMLLSASIEAARLGLGRVVWPIHAGPNVNIDLDQLADVCDRALLVSQLVMLDLPRIGGGGGGPDSDHGGLIKIETPYADFTDAELMELALDLDAPLAACWWCAHGREQPCGTCDECRRWSEALTSVDPQGLLDAGSLWGSAAPPIAA